MQFDFVITVCDNARESCPIWPGQPIVAHWGLPDPALAEGSDEDKLRQFKQAAQTLAHRIGLFIRQRCPRRRESARTHARGTRHPGREHREALQFQQSRHDH